MCEKIHQFLLLRTTTTALLTDYTACCRMEYNIVLFTMLYYNLVDAQLSQLGLQGEKRKELKRRTQRSSSSGGRVRNIRRRRQRVGDGVPATHCTRRQPASGGRNRPSPTSSRRTRRTFRNRVVRQTAATKPPEQQRVQLSSDSGRDRVWTGGGSWYINAHRPEHVRLVRCLSVNCQLVSQVSAPEFSQRARRRKPR